MRDAQSIHFLTVGTSPELIRNLWAPIAKKSGYRFSHLVHPGLDRRSWPDAAAPDNILFFADDLRVRMPDPDRPLLSALEASGVPTLHNMILGDRVVSRLPYLDALAYSTFLARRLGEVYALLAPSAIIGGFDALHGALAPAVARRDGIPWFALHFSAIPAGMACFCDRLTPASRVHLQPRAASANRALAEESLEKFEGRQLQAPAYLAPASRSVSGQLGSLPQRFRAVMRTLQKYPRRHYLRYSAPTSSFNVVDAVHNLRRSFIARRAAMNSAHLMTPPRRPYVFFGLHMQPESSIDVWAPFFSNQKWVIELLSRSIPPTHALLVKIHKSDIAKYSPAELQQLRQLPGVELVAPFTDARQFIEQASLIILIQGTIGLEAALMGKPVIMLEDSPFTIFPSVTAAGRISELPQLVRRKLSELPVGRAAIVNAYQEYLEPFVFASSNDWSEIKSDVEISGYCKLFNLLSEYVAAELNTVCCLDGVGGSGQLD